MGALEIPYNTCQQDDRRLDEEVSLLLDPCFIEVEHYGIGTFIGIGNVGHEGRGDRIAAVAPFGVIEVYHIEPCRLGILVLMLQKVIIDDGGQVCEFEM